METALILAIIEKLLVYGPGVVVEVAAAFENAEPTADDIRALKITKKPEDYFK
jgi:hypothetical protein